MQPEPPIVSQNDSSANTQNSSTSDQHGLSHDYEESSATPLSREDVGRTSAIAVESDATSVSSEGSRRGRDACSRRLNSCSSNSSSSSQRGSPVNRVEEYERQQTYSRRTSDRITFQVVPSTRGSEKGVSIEEFPNGRADLWFNFGEYLLTSKQKF
jgi:hypothetical protein